MQRYTEDRLGLSFFKHESRRHELHGERKSEEQKLNRLKKLLQTKVLAGSNDSKLIQAA
jgi:hypothetical protein